MVEIHAKEELGSLTLTVAKYSEEPMEVWDVEIAHGQDAIEMSVEDLDNVRETIDEMIEQVKDR